jgi:acyl carrier protein
MAAGQLAAADSLAADLAVHWLDLLELALTIEEQLDVSLPDTLLEGVQTYGDLEALVVDRRRHPRARRTRRSWRACASSRRIRPPVRSRGSWCSRPTASRRSSPTRAGPAAGRACTSMFPRRRASGARIAALDAVSTHRERHQRAGGP